uniref:Uncharacterized protein n=1 Tax=Phlebotomus papatasi TaxID=29031 RepID=A0A1B0D866_PHLPP
MCTPTSSCTINEGKHFESVFVVAHEIGHNLGMRHDTSDNNCDPSLYIMSPTLGSGKITWSKCSREYLNKFLESSQAQCLFDRGHSAHSLDHAAEGMLPGERFDADQQCMLKYGKDSVRSRNQPLPDICRDLHCLARVNHKVFVVMPYNTPKIVVTDIKGSLGVGVEAFSHIIQHLTRIFYDTGIVGISIDEYKIFIQQLLRFLQNKLNILPIVVFPVDLNTAIC